jgi:hypothetical protein
MPIDFFLHNPLTFKTLQNLNFVNFFWMQVIIFLLMLLFCTISVHFQHNIDYKTRFLVILIYLNLFFKSISKSVKGVIL